MFLQSISASAGNITYVLISCVSLLSFPTHVLRKAGVANLRAGSASAAGLYDPFDPLLIRTALEKFPALGEYIFGKKAWVEYFGGSDTTTLDAANKRLKGKFHFMYGQSLEGTLTCQLHCTGTSEYIHHVLVFYERTLPTTVLDVRSFKVFSLPYREGNPSVRNSVEGGKTSVPTILTHTFGHQVWSVVYPHM